MRGLPQADAVCFGMRWSGWLSLILTGRSCSFALGSSSLDLVGVGGFHRVPSPLSSFGMWSPFGVNCAFLSLLIANEGFHWRCFLFRCSLPFRGRVVVFLRPLQACRRSWWLVPTLLPGLSLYLPVPCLLLASSAA